MTKEELIGYCRYYKGEEKCPYEYENSDKVFFWNVESLYVQNAMDSVKWCEGWEAYVQKYMDDNPDEKNIYNLWSDFPEKLTDEEVRIFCKENQYWVKDFKGFQDRLIKRGFNLDEL